MTDRLQLEQHAATAKIQNKRGFSIVWIVPLVALVIGAWLAYKAISEKGPTITLTFASGEGLEAGKTKIKYREVEVGQVEHISLSEDISKVVVTAKMIKGTEPYLTDRTKFWVVRPRVNGGSVSGLGTFLSGVYIGIDGNKMGKPTHMFTGLEVPPVVTAGQPGRHFRLNTDTLGSLDIGAPIYYRQIQVGQVVGYNLDQDGKEVDIQIFIEAPHHKRVTENTRFWNASGIDVTLNAQGLKVDTQSAVSILSGGIAFELPKDAQPGNEAMENAMFHLYPDHSDILEKTYSIRNYWMLVFDQSVRGLHIGAPVELHGIKVGEIVDLNLEFDAGTNTFQVPVVIVIEPERIRVINQKKPQEVVNSNTKALVKVLVEQQGLRAQLQSGNLLTGQLMVSLVFVPDAPKKTLSHRDGYTVVPTIPGSFEQVQERLSKIIANLEKVPFNTIGTELQQTLQEARATLKQVGGLADTINRETVPRLQTTITELQNTMVVLQGVIGNDSPLNYDLRKTIEELSQTLSAFRELMETLENRPQSIIFGKGEEDHE